MFGSFREAPDKVFNTARIKNLKIKDQKVLSTQIFQRIYLRFRIQTSIILNYGSHNF